MGYVRLLPQNRPEFGHFSPRVGNSSGDFRRRIVLEAKDSACYIDSLLVLALSREFRWNVKV